MKGREKKAFIMAIFIAFSNIKKQIKHTVFVEKKFKYCSRIT